MFNHVKIDDLPESVRPKVLRLQEIVETAVAPQVCEEFAGRNLEHRHYMNMGSSINLGALVQFREFAQKANRERGDINEPQYQARLREAGDDKNRLSLTAMQYAYRGKLLSTILEYYQKLLELDKLLSEAEKLIASVKSEIDDIPEPTRGFILAGSLEISNLAREVRMYIPITMKYVDGVQGLPWYACYEAMQEIFRDLSLRYPKFGHNGYDFNFIESSSPEGHDAFLQEAVLEVQRTLYHNIQAVFRYTGAKSKLNRRQYQSRLDQASVRGETELFDQIAEEQRIKEAEFYRAVQELRHCQAKMVEAAEVLEPVLKEAYKQLAAKIEAFDFDSMHRHEPKDHSEKCAMAIQLHIEMNNCISASKWVWEAFDRFVAERDYDAILKEFIPGFDPEEFLAEMTA